MVCKNRGVYGFLGPSGVLITTYIIAPPVIVPTLVFYSNSVYRASCARPPCGLCRLLFAKTACAAAKSIVPLCLSLDRLFRGRLAPAVVYPSSI